MFRLSLICTLFLGGLGHEVLAQRLVTQTTPLGAGQGVSLNLKFAQYIRVRPGTGGLSVRATVSLNDNQANDLYALTLDASDPAELRVVEKLDEEKLRQTNFTGDCAGGSRNNSRGGWQGGYTRSSKTGGLRPTLTNSRDGYSYCIKVDYEVTLPAGTTLRVSTLSGDLDLSELSGAVTVKTVSGDLRASALTGPLNLYSVSGDVQLSGLPGTSPVDASSVSGDVRLSWPAARPAELSLKSVSGEVYADSSATFDNLRPRQYVGYELRGRVGAGGGPLLTLHSVSGDVFFRKE